MFIIFIYICSPSNCVLLKFSWKIHSTLKTRSSTKFGLQQSVVPVNLKIVPGRGFLDDGRGTKFVASVDQPSLRWESAESARC